MSFCDPKRASEDAIALIEAVTHPPELADRTRHLCRFSPGRGPSDSTVIASNDAESIGSFVTRAVEAGTNAYFTSNPVNTNWSGDKPSKDDIAKISVLSIDLDPPKPGAGENPATYWAAKRAEMKALGASITAMEAYQPTAVVFSGNGLQLHYRLTEPAEAADWIEDAWHEDVLQPLGADSTQNRDRLLRLPGLNVRQNRPDGVAELICADGNLAYSLDEMEAIRDDLMAVDGWPVSTAAKAKTKCTSDEGYAKLERRSLELLSGAREVTKENLSEKARDLYLESPTLFKRLNGDAEGLNDPSGSAFLMSIAGACKEKAANFDIFVELAYACEDACLHLEKLDDQGAARALARAWGNAGGLNATAKPSRLDQNALAEAFIECHDGRFQHDHTTGRWLINDRGRWAETKKGQATQACRELATALRGQSGKTAISKTLISGALDLAKSDPRLAVTSDDFDRDPMLLGVPDGVVNLHTGQLRRAKPEDMISKQASVRPDPAMPTPAWDAFLRSATSGDEDLITFLLDWSGYNLTGQTSEQKMLLLLGVGGTGKSVLLSVLAEILGDYSATLPTGALIAGKYEAHPEWLARLDGARFLAATETPGGRAWDEPLVKRLTGGDRMTARSMRQNSFEFQPKFKLSAAGNEAPRTTDDPAMRRRMLVVRFDNIPPNPDDRLLEKLRGEYPGILAQFIEGAVRWHQCGLSIPHAVKDAIDGMFSLADPLRDWLDTECIANSGDERIWATAEDLFQSYTNHAHRSGNQRSYSKARLGQELEKRGYRSDRRKVDGKQIRVRYGIKLNGSVPMEAQQPARLRVVGEEFLPVDVRGPFAPGDTTPRVQ